MIDAVMICLITIVIILTLSVNSCRYEIDDLRFRFDLLETRLKKEKHDDKS